MAQATFFNSGEYLSMARIAHHRRFYGKAYALAVLGIEQLGLACACAWIASGSWDRLPQEFRTHLIGSGRRTTVLADHERKQGVFAFALAMIMLVIGVSVELKRSKTEPIEVYSRRAAVRTSRLLRFYAPDIRRLQDRKFRGLYVDLTANGIRGPWEVRAADATKVRRLLEWMSAAFRDEVLFPNTPRQTSQFHSAIQAVAGDLGAFAEANPDGTVAQYERAAARAWKNRMKNTRPAKVGVATPEAAQPHSGR